MNSFISVLENPNRDTTITFTVTSVNNDFLAGSTFSFSVDLLAADSPQTTALKIYTALQAKLAENNGLLKYGGTCPFTPEEIPFSFRVYITEHIVSIWSQSQFLISTTAISDDIRMSIKETPTFPLMCEASDIATVKGVSFVDHNGDPMTDNEIQIALEMASAQVCAWLRGFNVVLSTYLHSEVGQWWRGYCLRFNPVTFYDPISVRGPYIPNYVGALGATVVQRFNVDEFTGMVDFLDFSESLQLREIGDFGNQIHQTYAAGYSSVPDVLKTESVRVLGMTKEPLSIKSIRGGRGALEFKDKTDVMREVLYNLQEFAP